jgi:hypothetical protein
MEHCTKKPGDEKEVPEFSLVGSCRPLRMTDTRVLRILCAPRRYRGG